MSLFAGQRRLLFTTNTTATTTNSSNAAAAATSTHRGSRGNGCRWTQEQTSLVGWCGYEKTPPSLTTTTTRSQATTSFSTRVHVENNGSDFEYQDIDGDDSNVLSQQPWKGLLEKPARCGWRSSPPLPEHHALRRAQRIVLESGDRTDRQLARAHRKVVALQSTLAESREQERRRIVSGGTGRSSRRGLTRNGLDIISTGDVKQRPTGSASTHTQKKGFVPNDDLSGSSDVGSAPESQLIYGYDETLSALKHRLVPHYAITKRVLQECKNLVEASSTENPPVVRRILDFGVGCGSASAAAIDVFGGFEYTGSGGTGSSSSFAPSSPGIQWIHGIDPSQPCRQCSKLFLEEYVEQLVHEERQQLAERQHGSTDHVYQRRRQQERPRFTFGSSLSVDRQQDDDNPNPKISAKLDGGGRGSPGFDLILSTYTASDMPDLVSFVSAAAIMFEKLSPNGLLVFIEPGTPDGFSSLRSVRNMLLDCCRPSPPSLDGDEDHDDDEQYEYGYVCQIVAPCTHHGTCPMERHKRDFDPKKGKLAYDVPQEDVGADNHVSLKSEQEPNGTLLTAVLDDHDIKDSLRSDNRNDKLELNIASETTAFERSFCSFVHNINNLEGRSGGGGGDRSEKFTYLVVQKKRYERFGKSSQEACPPNSDEPKNIPSLLSSAFDAAASRDEELARKIFRQAQELDYESSPPQLFEDDDDEEEEEEEEDDEERDVNMTNEFGLHNVGSPNEDWGRIVRAPIKKKGHVYVDYCAGDPMGGGGGGGQIIRSRVTKAVSQKVAPGMYTAARKARWGGLFPRLDVITSAGSGKK